MSTIDTLAAAALTLVCANAFAAEGPAFDFGHPSEPARATRTVHISLTDMSFSPNQLEVKAGETIRFELVNHGRIEHEFTLGDAALQAHHQEEMLAMAAMDRSKMNGTSMAGMHNDPNSVSLKPGQTAQLTWTFTRPAQLEFACNEPGHYQAGMVGQLTVDK